MNSEDLLELAVEALEAGIHVVTEKPMAIDAPAAQRMVKAAHKAGRLVMVALNNRFRTESQLLKSWIEKANAPYFLLPPPCTRRFTSRAGLVYLAAMMTGWELC